MRENERFKKIRYGVWSIVLTIAVILVVMLVNYVFGEAEDRFAWTLDLSVNRQFSISDETRSVVEALQEDVHIYTLYSESSSSAQRQMMEEILKHYEAIGHVKTENLDMLANPASVSRFRTEDTQLAQLHHVTDALRARNYEPRELHLSNTDAVVREGDVVVAVAPSQDLSETEYESLKAFLAEGGRLYYASNYVSGALPYFDMLLSLYGLEVDKGLLVEDVGYVEYYYRNQLYLMPDIHLEPEEAQMNAAAGFERGDYVVLPQSQAIRTTEMRDMGVLYESVLTTSPKAYIKSELTQSTTLEREEKDESGTFHMAVAMQQSRDSGMDTRIFVVGNALFLMDSSLFTAYDNDELLFSPLSWLVGAGTSIQVPARNMGSYVIRMPSNTVYHALTILVIGVIPAVILISGMIVWRRRRHL